MTTAAQQAVIDLLVPGAQRAAREYPGTYASVCIGQAILESGWGKSTLAAQHFNFHGIKWNGNPKGPFPLNVTGTVEMGTWERPDSGDYLTRALFRTYADPVGSCLDWAANLRATSAYGKAGAWEAKSADEFITAIGKPYTGGDSQYAGKVLSLMDSHNLRNYDLEAAVNIPTIRENDPKVWITTKSKSGWGCVCMQITLPLVEAEMKRRGLIKSNIDFFQLGYNAGGVAASAGTHDGGGVVDCAQGITRDQRLVWAEFGWMMAPRTRQYGWTTGDHGHGVLHGCVHRSAGAASQIRSMMAGRNGLVSNLFTDWVKPSRTWQDAVRALAPVAAKPSPAPSPEPAVNNSTPTPGASMTHHYNECHANTPGVPTEDWNNDEKGFVRAMPEIFSPQGFSADYRTTCYIDASAGTTVQARLVEYIHGSGWHRHPIQIFHAVAGSPTTGQVSHNGRTYQGGVQVWVDIKTDLPDPVMVRAYTHTTPAN